MAIQLPIISKFDDKGVKEAQYGFEGLGSGLVKLGGLIAATFSVAAITDFAKSAVTAASDLNETTAAVGQVFGDASKTLEDFAKSAPKNLGQTQTQFLDAAKTFGIFGKAAGLAGEDNAAFSKQLAILATDLASFNNTSVDEAITAIGAGLRGESEPLRRFGVLLDDATLKARAMSLGIYDGTGTLTQQQRVLAAQSEILAQTTTQQGDFARTSEGAANATRIFQASVGELKTSVGEALLPALEQILPKLTDFVDNMITNPEFQQFLSDLGQSLIDMLPKLESSVENLGKLALEVLPALNPLLDTLGGVLDIVATGLSNVSTNGNDVWKSLKNISEIVDFVNKGLKDWNDFFNDVTKNAGDMGPVLEGVFNAISSALDPVTRGLQAVVDLIHWINGNPINKSGISYNKNGTIDHDGNPATPFALGGIVTGPTHALIGEAGPEAVIPLEKMSQVMGSTGGGATYNISVNAGMGVDGAALGEQIVTAIRKYERTSGKVFAAA